MNNAQLIKTLAKKRTANFREDETRLLISLWGSPQIQNKLNLTHRKAPVMRLIAANMQQRGFYRSPDEIKTRIRNLKCLYHRIKRTITSGSGIGTVDPDWPHFKAMDAILGDPANGANKIANGNGNGCKIDEGAAGDGPFEVKQEIDINDDLESWNGNDSIGSEYDDDLKPASLPEPAITITTTPCSQPAVSVHSGVAPPALVSQPRAIACAPPGGLRPPPQPPNLALPPSIPLPFLILNSLKPNGGGGGGGGGGLPPPQNVHVDMGGGGGAPPNKRRRDAFSDDFGVANVLNQLLDIQKQQLDVDKQRLEVEKQRLEFDRLVGSQLMTLVPMMGSLVQRLVFPQNNVLNKTFDMASHHCQDGGIDPMEPDHEQHVHIEEDELEKNRNILRNLLNQGIKARMMEQNKNQQQQQQQQNEEEILDKDKDEYDAVDALAGPSKDKAGSDSGENETTENDDNESCVLLINENSAETNDENN